MAQLKCQLINDLAGATEPNGVARPCWSTHVCVCAATEKTKDGIECGGRFWARECGVRDSAKGSIRPQHREKVLAEELRGDVNE
jgi:hypothetical protein